METLCLTCYVYYDRRYKFAHEQTEVHRRHLIQRGAGENLDNVTVTEIESSVFGRLKTYYVKEIVPTSKDVITFLKNVELPLENKIRNQLSHYALKINLILNTEFKKDDVSSERTFKTKNTRIFRSDDIKETLNELFGKILKEKSELQLKGSGYSLDKILGLELRINQYNPLDGSTFLELPEEIKNKKAVINVRNDDEFCFKYAIWGKNVEKDPQRVSKYKTLECERGYIWNCISYPVEISKISTFEKVNNISINVFAFDEKDGVYPIKVIDSELKDHRDLLYITNGATSHYCWIKDFGKLVHSQLTKNHKKINICKRCFCRFKNEEALNEHKIYCGKNAPSKIELPTAENKWLKFKNFNHSLRVPYIIIADFECLLHKISSCQPSDDHCYTTLYQKHTPYSFCYLVVSDDGKISDPVLYRGPNAVKVFLQKMKDEAIKISELYKNIIPMKELTREEEESFQSAENCYVCGKVLNNDRVHDHSHLTGSYRYPLHSACNLNYKNPTFLPIFLHNSSMYDGKFIIPELGYDEKQIDCIPNSEEKFISFTKWIIPGMRIKFVDTYRFMSSSLSTLVENLPRDKFIQTERVFREKIDLVRRKGVYCYDYTDSWEKLDETCLPSKDKFYNQLNECDISEDDYNHAKTVWNDFKIKTLGEYSDLYLITDVVLLADVFQNFRDVCLAAYELDPAWYVTVSGLTFDAMLKQTKIELELLTDYNMILMVEAGIRGGISQCSHRYSEANNKYLKNFNPNLESNFIIYLDFNNLYGWAMSQYLPYSGFRWLNDEEIENFDVCTIADDSPKGYILEVDLIYPENLHHLHSDLPLCPENKIPPNGKDKKLLNTLHDKNKYIIHYINLKQALSLNLKLKAIHRVIEFNQSPWLKPYIDFNTSKRKSAVNDFDKDFFKLMNNAVFGKTMENVRKRVNINLVSSTKRCNKLISKPTFLDRTILSENISVIHLRKSSYRLDKPIYLGFTILDISKILMFDFHYGKMKREYGDKLKLCYSDTDSMIYSVKTDDFYADMVNDINSYDTSNYPNEHFCFSSVNKKVLGKMKDECNGEIITHFCGLRSKLYAYKIENSKVEKRAKGVKRSVVERSLNFEDYVCCLRENRDIFRKMKFIRSKKLQIFSVESNKRALSASDDKRYICDDGISTLAWGHKNIPNLKRLQTETGEESDISQIKRFRAE